MKKVFITLFVACMASFSFAENNQVKNDAKAETKAEKVQLVGFSGNVIDQKSGEALVGVEVKLEGTDVKTYTDFDGHFVFENLKPGEYKLVSSYTSYDKNVKNLDVKSNSNQIKIELQASK
jgi:hypothetical protein